MGHIIVNRDKTDDVAKQYPVKIYINEKENFTNVNGKVTVNATIYTNIFLTKDKGHLEAPSLPVLENYQYMKTGTQLQPSYDYYYGGTLGKSCYRCYSEYRSNENTPTNPLPKNDSYEGLYTYDNDNNPHPYYGYLHRNVDGDNSIKYMHLNDSPYSTLGGITNIIYDDSTDGKFFYRYKGYGFYGSSSISEYKKIKFNFTDNSNATAFSNSGCFSKYGVLKSNENLGAQSCHISLANIYPQNKDSYFKNIKIDTNGNISFNGYHGLCDNVVIKGKLPNSEYLSTDLYSQTKQNSGFLLGTIVHQPTDGAYTYSVQHSTCGKNYNDMHGYNTFLYNLGFDFYTENSDLPTTQKKIKQFVTDLFSGTELENKYVKDSHHYNRLLKLFCTGENGFYTPPQERLLIENFCGKRYNSPDFWLARLAGGYEKERKNIENKNNIFYIVGQDNSEIEYEENVFPAHIKAGDEFATLTSNSINRYASNPFSAVFRFRSKGKTNKKLELEKIDIKKVVIPKTKEIKDKSSAPYFRILQNEITPADYNLLLPEETCDIFYNSKLFSLPFYYKENKRKYPYRVSSIFNNIFNYNYSDDLIPNYGDNYKEQLRFIFKNLGLYDKDNIADYAMSNSVKRLNEKYTYVTDIFNNYKNSNNEIDLIKMLGNDNISNLLSIKGGKGDYTDDAKSLKLDFNMSVNNTDSELSKYKILFYSSFNEYPPDIRNVFTNINNNNNNELYFSAIDSSNFYNIQKKYQYIYVMPVEINVNLTFDTEHIKKHVDEDFTYYSSEEWFIDLYQNIDNDMDNMVDVDEQYSVTWDYKSSVNEFYFLDNNGEQYTNFSSLISQDKTDIIESMFTFYALINDITGTYEKLGNDEYKMVFSKDGKISIKLNKKKIYDRAQKLKIPQPKHPFIKADFHSKIKTTIGGEFASNAKCKEIL